jgi:magnesium-transporting ATPase (P-type)
MEILRFSFLTDSSALISADDFDKDLVYAAVGCQSLVCLNGYLVGDPMEDATIRALQWQVSRSGDVVHKKGFGKLQLLHRFHFSSQLKRMSVVLSVETLSSQSNSSRSLLVVTKGAPETIRQFLRDVPRDYDDVYRAHALQVGCLSLPIFFSTFPLPTFQSLSLFSPSLSLSLCNLHSRVAVCWLSQANPSLSAHPIS